jgi:cytochrome c-type biogenesis protein CcmH
MSRTETLKRQIHELDGLLAAGTLTSDVARAKRAELEAQLLAAVVGTPPQPDAVPAPALMQARPSTRLVLSLAVGILVFGVAGYAWKGNREGLSVAPGVVAEPAAAPEAGASAPHQIGSAQIEAMVERLAQKLEEHPDDAEGWYMLGRSYSVLGKRAEAVEAFRKLVALRPKDGGALADLADAVASRQGSLDGEPQKLIEQAVAASPDNPKALSLAATVAFNSNDMPKAADLWQRALKNVDPASELARQIQGALNEARSRAGLPPLPAVAMAPEAPVAAEPAPAAAPAAAGASIKGRVSLAPALQGKAAPEDTLFVFARAAKGGMPLAIIRRQVKDLPFEFTLDDSLAMSPAARLSGAGEVTVGARISKSGSATPAPGDLQGSLSGVKLGAAGLQLVIDTAR